MADAGDTIGPYVVEGLLARGGMGSIYRARNRVTGQVRALKLVRSDRTDPDYVDRFVREASIAARVRHPNVVESFEPGIDGDVVYLPMELLEGQTLATRIAERGRFSPADTLAIIRPVAHAVHSLHEHGLIHRDLKPTNIFLARTSAGEVPKVLDLGAAREPLDDEHTRTGVVVGSPSYMALEQAEGRRDLDGRVDQYALAVIAYEMLTGQRPYQSDDTSSALAKLLRGDGFTAPDALDVPEKLAGVLMRALSRSREQRFATTEEFARALSHATDGGEPSPSVPAAVAPTVRRISCLPAVAAGVILTAVLVTIAAMLLDRPSHDAAGASVLAPARVHDAPEGPSAAEHPEEPAPLPPPAPADAGETSPHEDTVAAPSRNRPRQRARQRLRVRGARRAAEPSMTKAEPCGASTGIPCL